MRPHMLLFYIMIAFVVVFSLSGLTAYFTHNALLAVGVLISCGFISYFYLKRIKPYVLHVSFNSEGLIIDNSTIYKWDDIQWYHVTASDEIGIIDQISLKLKNGERLNFPFYKPSKKKEDWNQFKDRVLKNLESREHNVKNYYESKVWTYIAYIIIASYFIGFFVIWFMDLEFSRIFPPLGGYIAGTSVLVSAILYNQRKNSKKKKA
ncbi:MAG: hypothetical protein AB2L24_30230 [Mangrovibacterium sp.]